MTNWFRESTSDLEKLLASFAAHELPCSKDEFVAKSHQTFPELSAFQVEAELQDLVTADVLDINRQGRLDFTFPAAREIARQGKDYKSAVSELRSQFRQWLNKRSVEPHL